MNDFNLFEHAMNNNDKNCHIPRVTDRQWHFKIQPDVVHNFIVSSF